MEPFSVTLGQEDWDAELGGWRCPALRLPGIRVEEVVSNGAAQDSSWYQSRPEFGLLKWIRGTPPARVVVLVRLTEALVSKRSAQLWKRLAIVLPFVGTVGSAFIAKGCDTFSGRCLSWQSAAQGVVPERPFDAGGYEYADKLQGWPLYVCRAGGMNADRPGKLVPGYGCMIAVNDTEIQMTEYDVLIGVDARTGWVSSAGVIPPRALRAGHDPHGPLYVCRAHYETGVQIGHVGTGTGHKCQVSFGGRAFSLDDYEVLSVKQG